ncbi:hypothetical protein GCM10023220_35260 [Streptomyces ziwulingensis]|uniref:Transposase n=1 Tax=Streptomyces ziwulingensis TaxID=1045501 RepID=A0ABP9C124_9ACTN
MCASAPGACAGRRHHRRPRQQPRASPSPGSSRCSNNLTHVPRGRGAHGRLQKAGKKKPNVYLPKHQYVLAPTTLSRHAVVHHLPLSHLNAGHCIIAVMLLISIIRETQERYDGIRDDLLMQASG